MKPGEEIQSVSGWQTLSDRDIEQHWRQSEAASKSPQTHQLLNVTHNVGATILHHGNSGYTELDLNGLNTAGLVPPWFMHPELIAGPVNEVTWPMRDCRDPEHIPRVLNESFGLIVAADRVDS